MRLSKLSYNYWIQLLVLLSLLTWTMISPRLDHPSNHLPSIGKNGKNKKGNCEHERYYEEHKNLLQQSDEPGTMRIGLSEIVTPP